MVSMVLILYNEFEYFTNFMHSITLNFKYTHSIIIGIQLCTFLRLF